MKLVLDTKATVGKRKSRLQERFDKLRSKLESARRRNARFQKDLDELVEIYQRGSLENDKAAFGDLVALTEKLIDFAGRKSLSAWHREELDDWLRDLIMHRIARLDPQLSQRLLGAYSEVVARSMGISVDELAERLSAETAEAARAEWDGDEGLDEGSPQEDLFGFGDEAAPFDAGAQEHEGAEGWDNGRDDIGQTVMDGSWAKSLFRRAAQALHPDREPDPERRRAKQALMGELLRARKEGDLMTMLALYSDSVSGADIVVAEQEMADVCALLEDQLYGLEWEKEEYVYSHPLRILVFEHLYHGTEKGRKRRVEQWEQEMRLEMTELRTLVPYLRNLTCLKGVLEDRRNDRTAILTDLMFRDMPF